MTAALALLPSYVARRTVADEVREVPSHEPVRHPASRTARRRTPPRPSNPPSANGRICSTRTRCAGHIDQLFRAAWALCGSRDDAEDLVQETFVNVLKRPRLLRDGNEIGYLLRALRNTYASRYRRAARRRASGS